VSQPAVFFDRDGTLSREVGYVNHVRRIEAISGGPEAVKRLNDAGIPVVVVSNQAGAARGYFPQSLIDEVNAELSRQYELKGAHFDAIYYCPHLKGSNAPEFNVECDCRKPKTGMVDQAAAELDLDLWRSFMVGDKYSDVQLGFAMNAKGILVMTGYGRGELQWFQDGWHRMPDLIAEDLTEVVDYVLKKLEL
jgi:D-glycero-D-manno-heptose 1,7-bisphosphate phosphatase